MKRFIIRSLFLVIVLVCTTSCDIILMSLFSGMTGVPYSSYSPYGVPAPQYN